MVRKRVRADTFVTYNLILLLGLCVQASEMNGLHLQNPRIQPESESQDHHNPVFRYEDYGPGLLDSSPSPSSGANGPANWLLDEDNDDSPTSHVDLETSEIQLAVNESGPTYSIVSHNNATINDSGMTLNNNIKETLEHDEETGNCTPASIDEFPKDLFSSSKRKQGFVVVHIVAAIYIYYAIAIVCDEYFVPSVERLAMKLNLSNDIAGATLMAVASSSPELFTNFVGTFITKGDIGLGTVVGSAVFNVLAVGACIGLCSKKSRALDWWPITRDLFFYILAVICLFFCLWDEAIMWYESINFILLYCAYLIGIYNNNRLREFVKWLSGRRKPVVCSNDPKCIDGHDHDTKNVNVLSLTVMGYGNGTTTFQQQEDTREDKSKRAAEVEEETQDYRHEDDHLFKGPVNGNFGVWTRWVISWPIRCVFKMTIPNCKHILFKNLYALTFLMCVIWIGCLSYFATWMVTIVGSTLDVPDSIMGLTFIAAGTSVPEAVTSITVARKGKTIMAFSNAFGSNIFDILICLGLPWFIRDLAHSSRHVKIHSGTLRFAILLLLLSIIILFVVLVMNKFIVNRRVGFISLGSYAVFLVIGSLLELNVFFNLPPCSPRQQ